MKPGPRSGACILGQHEDCRVAHLCECPCHFAQPTLPFDAPPRGVEEFYL